LQFFHEFYSSSEFQIHDGRIRTFYVKIGVGILGVLGVTLQSFEVVIPTNQVKYVLISDRIWPFSILFNIEFLEDVPHYELSHNNTLQVLYFFCIAASYFVVRTLFVKFVEL
jgi:hypothetical protein